MHYHDSDDPTRLADFNQLAPAEFSNFVEFDKIVGRDEGAIPRKYRELIAIAVACTTQCPYCLDPAHSRCQTRGRQPRRSCRDCAAGCRPPSWSRGHPWRFGDEVVRPRTSSYCGQVRRPLMRGHRFRVRHCVPYPGRNFPTNR